MRSSFRRTRMISIERRRKPKQAASHKFAYNTRDIESSEDEFQGLTRIQSRGVRTREG